MSVEENKKNIQGNRRKIFDLENAVLYNKGQAYLVRSLVQENQASISRNYFAAFLGNRQLANANTEDIFRNRTAIVRNIETPNPVLVNYREALLNKVKLDFLEHRSKLNEKVLSISEQLAAVNRQLIDINRQILDANEEIVKFNADQIAANSQLLSSGVNASSATSASNAALVAENARRIEEIGKRASENKSRISKVRLDAESNKASITANHADINGRRQRILENHEKITANQQLVGRFVGKLLKMDHGLGARCNATRIATLLQFFYTSVL